MNDVKYKKILLVDDEPPLLKMLETILHKDGFDNIVTASTCAQALTALTAAKPGIAVLDVMLPDGDGFSLFREIKKRCDIPVLFLTARGEAEDRIVGLGLGADDYIVKPFLPKELTLRLENVLRRTYASAPGQQLPVFRLAACIVDLGKAEVVKDTQTIPLTAKEHALLLVLHQNASRIVTTDVLCRAAWGDDGYGYDNTLMVHIRRIREKIESDPSAPVSLVTVKGLGYKLLV